MAVAAQVSPQRAAARQASGPGGALRRYAFVSDAVYPYQKGGKETRLYEICHRLAQQRGVKVDVYTMKWWDEPGSVHMDGVDYHAISRLYPLYRGDRRSMLQAVLFGLATLRMLTKSFDVLDVDHMPFFPLFSARLVCLLKRRPLMGTWHEVWGRSYWFEYLGPLGVVGFVTERLAFRMPHLIVANSDQTASRLRLHAPSARIETVSLGVDLHRIGSIPMGSTESEIIFAGRLLPHKNADLLIDAVAELVPTLPNLRCLIIGEGPERERLVEQASERGLSAHVSFLDFIDDYDELLGHIKASRVLVLPSEREGFGLVVVEANACGVPVVTLDHPDNAARHLIEPGVNGYLCTRNPASLAEAIMLALSHPRPLSLELDEKQDWSAVARRVGDLFETHLPPMSRAS